MTAERRTSDYSDISMPNFRIFPDLIPGVGAITYIERNRRASGESVRESIASTLHPDNVVSIGTKDWPEPTNWRALMRQQAMSIRNVGFSFYHVSTTLAATIIAIDKFS